MALSYRFQSILGAPYRGGGLVFQDGDLLYSPVGNRVQVTDLTSGKTKGLPTEASHDLNVLCISADGQLLLAVDEDSQGQLINLNKQIVLNHCRFGKHGDTVTHALFSQDGKYVAVAVKSRIEIWEAPNAHQKEFIPWHRVRVLGQQAAAITQVTCIDWSDDSNWLVAGSKDGVTRIFSTTPREDFQPARLSAHKQAVVRCFFAPNSSNSNQVITISRDGALFKWAAEEKGNYSSQWKQSSKFFFSQRNAELTAADLFHRQNGSENESLVVAGFSSGVFGIYQLSSMEQLHLLSASQESISSVCFNRRGDWLAIGCASLGQLIVWEWRSETYISKQQGHSSDIQAASFSGDGQYIATGGDDAKLKLWSQSTGYCFVTFSNHSAPITGVSFVPAGHAVISSSLDGTVRAFDMIRYRNFRTLTAPEPTQFVCVSVDPGGEIVCAGTRDDFQIYVWSLRTGRLLTVLSGHEGPVVSLQFSGTHPILASASWDKTVRLWDVFRGRGCVETLTHDQEIICIAYRPDGKELCSSSMNGQLTFWDPLEGDIKTLIDGNRDIAGGRLTTDLRSADNATEGRRYFTTIAYSADGAYLFAGGNSKYVCVYDTSEKVMLRRFQLSSNRSLDGILDKLNSSRLTDAGQIDLLDYTLNDDDDYWQRFGKRRKVSSLKGLPGVSAKRKKAVIRSACLTLAPDGRSWATATPEGLLVYSLDNQLQYDPLDLDVDVTPEAAKHALKREEYTLALMLSLRLNDNKLVQDMVEAVPLSKIKKCAQDLPSNYLKWILSQLSRLLQGSPHLEHTLLWLESILIAHGRHMRRNSSSFSSVMKSLMRGLGVLDSDLQTAALQNLHMLMFLSSVSLEDEQGSKTKLN